MIKEEEIGRIMAKWAFLGVGVGLLGTYAYLGLLNKKKSGLLIVGSLFTMAGLSVGSYIGAEEVEELKNKTE